jgi:E3 ubiquitin-protein ligase MARCH6
MFAELVIFPTTIGGVIQICLVPMFPGWSIEKLFGYLHEVPFGTLFTTWIVGTSSVLPRSQPWRG